ncbi:hypothetical protein PUNSTDRAFT_54323 [Punctularia strigosozonata HHB-11173 SS5]|uniref:uncharacterized protein n=1 Tax=Punctularia strigosozonata (strain HHB-11173) TaxID=741275 RepID=UPI0004417665|nr:uncharacterized protein PUNSTDRAFT_54323 [Punctularia strigosozonata HHB-11173 SS5]EIN06029.1 hypothetical protein PUNSTDRAFT_54323 [Punctularia strigosozonata HHB-11173 SS5]
MQRGRATWRVVGHPARPARLTVGPDVRSGATSPRMVNVIPPLPASTRSKNTENLAASPPFATSPRPSS